MNRLKKMKTEGEAIGEDTKSKIERIFILT